MAIFTEELDCKFFRSLQANVNQNTVSIVRRVKNNIHSFYWIWIKTYLVLIYLFHGENLAINPFYTSTVRLVDGKESHRLCFSLLYVSFEQRSRDMHRPIKCVSPRVFKQRSRDTHRPIKCVSPRVFKQNFQFIFWESKRVHFLRVFMFVLNQSSD